MCFDYKSNGFLSIGVYVHYTCGDDALVFVAGEDLKPALFLKVPYRGHQTAYFRLSTGQVDSDGTSVVQGETTQANLTAYGYLHE